jgi:hypothetical protein
MEMVFSKNDNTTENVERKRRKGFAQRVVPGTKSTTAARQTASPRAAHHLTGVGFQGIHWSCSCWTIYFYHCPNHEYFIVTPLSPVNGDETPSRLQSQAICLLEFVLL